MRDGDRWQIVAWMRRLAILLVVATTRAAFADVTEAERLYTEGQTAYDAKHYDAAVAAWDKSYALSKLPALVFNLAQAHRLANHCAKAVEAYHRFLVLDPQSDERASAEQFLHELEPCPATTTTPLVKPPITDQVVDRGHGKRVAGIVSIGAGTALLATGLYFGIQASSLANDVKAACTMGCEWATLEAKDSAGKRDAKLQYVFLGIGTAGIAAGAVLYVLGTKAKSTHVMVEPHGTGASLSWRGSW